MIDVNDYFYKTAVSFMLHQGLTLKETAEACGVRSVTLTRMLKRDGTDVSGTVGYELLQLLAPHLSLDELFVEALQYVSEQKASR